MWWQTFIQNKELFSVQLSLSHAWLFAALWTAARQASLSITISQSLLKLMSIELVIPSNHLVLCHPLLLPPSIFLSTRVFSNELSLCSRWPEYWSFSFSINQSNEYSGLISFRIDWFHLLVAQGTLRVFSSTTVWKHQFFGFQPSFWSNSHICTWLLKKTIALTRQNFVSKVMSLLFNVLSRLVIAVLPRSSFWFHGYSHHLQWFWSPGE